MGNEAKATGQDVATTQLNSLLASKDITQIDQGLRQAARLPIPETARALTYMVTANQSAEASGMIRAAFITLEDSLRNRTQTSHAPEFLDAERQTLEGFFQGTRQRLVTCREKHKGLEVDTVDSLSHLLQIFPEVAQPSSGLPGELLRSQDIAVIHKTLGVLINDYSPDMSIRELAALPANTSRAASELTYSAITIINTFLGKKPDMDGQLLANLFALYAEAYPRIRQATERSAIDFSAALSRLITRHPDIAPLTEVLLVKIMQTSDDTLELNPILEAASQALPIPAASRVVSGLAGNKSSAAAESLGSACRYMRENIDRNQATDAEKTDAAKSAEALRVAIAKSKPKDFDTNEQLQRLLEKI